MRNKIGWMAIVSLAMGFYASATLASRDLLEPIYRQGVVGLYTWELSSAQSEIVRALQQYTPEAREQALLALDKSGLLARARKEDARSEGTLLAVPTIQESVDSNGLLVWTLSAPLRIVLRRGDKTVLTTTLRANAKIVVKGNPGSSSLKIARIWFTDDKGGR